MERENQAQDSLVREATSQGAVQTVTCKVSPGGTKSVTWRVTLVPSARAPRALRLSYSPLPCRSSPTLKTSSRADTWEDTASLSLSHLFSWPSGQ